MIRNISVTCATNNKKKKIAKKEIRKGSNTFRQSHIWSIFTNSRCSMTKIQPEPRRTSRGRIRSLVPDGVSPAGP